MARIFSLNICFKSKEYLSLVTEQNFADNTFFIVRYVDNDLKEIIQEDHLLFNQKGELKQAVYLHDDQAVDLLQSTRKAVVNYMQQQSEHKGNYNSGSCV